MNPKKPRKIANMKIVTEYYTPPIPLRTMDWSAWDEDTYDGADDAGPRARLIGYGATEAEAIADLIAQIEEYADE